MEEIEERISRKIKELDSVSDILPSHIVIHRIVGDGSQVEYISPKALARIGKKLEDIQQMGLSYYTSFLNAEDAENYIPKILQMIKTSGPDEVFTFFQQVKNIHTGEWDWFLSSVKVLMLDNDGKPLLLILLTNPIDPSHHLTHKVQKLTEDNDFQLKNADKFYLLSDREVEILKGLAQGKSNKEIAEGYSISVSTVETHRKKIKAKLGVKNSMELHRYGSAFNLF